MKYNTAAKSLFEVFSNENPKYVSLAMKALKSEVRLMAIMTKRYGINFDGVGGVKSYSYIENEQLGRALIRVDSYIQTIKVLSEVHKETDEQILNKFYNHTDLQITNMMKTVMKDRTNATTILLPSKNAILTNFKTNEGILECALEHVENYDHKRIYMYYYGIARRKMNMNEILKIFPEFNESSVRKALLAVQTELTKYIQIEKNNVENDALNLSHRSNNLGFRYNSFFEYFYTKEDTDESKRKKDEIILNYMEIADKDEVQLTKKIFGSSYNQLNRDVKLSPEEREKFYNFKGKVKRYLNRILTSPQESKKKTNADDRIILTKDNGFKEKLNMYFERYRVYLAMDIFSHYLTIHEDAKEFFSQFYDLETMDLRSDVYSSKNDAAYLKQLVNSINVYIKNCSKISNTFKKDFINYFKKTCVCDATVQLLYESMVKYIETLSEEERTILQELYGEDYRKLNIYADISIEDFDKINLIIAKIEKHMNHVLKMLNSYKANLFIYFHKSGMSVSYKKTFDAEIKRFVDESSSMGKSVAVKLYGSSYSKLDPTVYLTEEEILSFNSLLKEVNEHMLYFRKPRKSKEFTTSPSFLNYFTDSNSSDEENKIIIEEVKKTIDNDNSLYKDNVVKYYGDNYDQRNSLEMSQKDKVMIYSYRKQLLLRVFGNKLPESIYDMVIDGRTNKDRKTKIIEETDNFINLTDEDIKVILRKVYGSDYHTFNKEVRLTSYELLIINRFNHDLNAYIAKKVPIIRTEKTLPEGFIKTKNGMLPERFSYFLNDIDKDVNLEEAIKELKSMINSSKSKYASSVKKLYGEELDKLDMSVVLPKEDIGRVRALIKSFTDKYKTETTTVLNFPPNVVDIYDISYDESEKDMIINRINYNISIRDSITTRTLHKVYGDDLKHYKIEQIPMTADELSSYNQTVKVINKLFTKELYDYNLKEDLLQYVYPDVSNRDELVQELSQNIESLDNLNGYRFKKLIGFMYDKNFKLIRPMKLKDIEVESFGKTIKYLKSLDAKVSFFDYFLFEDEEVVPESRKNDIVKIVRGSKSSRLNDVMKIFGTNLDQKISDKSILKKNNKSIKYAIKYIGNRLTKTFSRNIFMLADNYIEQFYLETDTPEIKEAIKNYLITRLAKSLSSMAGVVKSLYDENYNLKKDYTCNFEKNTYRSFIYNTHTIVLKYRDKLINGKVEKISTKNKNKPKRKPKQANKTIKLDMMDLGENGNLALTNDLFDIELIGNEENPVFESELTDDLFISAYNELMDSETIMDLLMVSSDTLVNFYLCHIDDLEDPTEAFNYLINLGDKDTIKKLMISPLFLRVVNYLTDIERQIIYLKLVQVSNSSLTDEIISKITKVDIDSIREYEIMTKDDKVNSLNNFILKRK